MSKAIRIPNENGEPVLVPVDNILLIEPVGPYHAKRGEYNNLTARIDGDAVLSVVLLVKDSKEGSFGSTLSVEDIHKLFENPPEARFA